MMNVILKFTTALVLLTTFTAVAQQPTVQNSVLFDPNYGVNLQPSMVTTSNLSSLNISSFFKPRQTTHLVSVNTNQIDFSTLPVLAPNNEFPTIYNTNKEPFIQLGDYDVEFLNKRANNNAFYEATRNTVLSAGYTNGGIIAPRF